MNNLIDIPVDVIELMPWYLTEKLSVEDQAHFENALDIYPELRKQLELERQMLVLISDDNSILNKRIVESPEERLKSVFKKIDNPKLQNYSKSSNVISIVDKLKENYDSRISDTDTNFNYSRVASVGILVFSVATLSAFMLSPKTETSDFYPASAKTQPSTEEASASNSTKATILVGFSGTADQLKDNESLKGKIVEIKNAPDNEGIYQINFKQAMSKDEIKQMINALQAQEDAIWFAGEAF